LLTRGSQKVGLYNKQEIKESYLAKNKERKKAFRLSAIPLLATK